MGTGIKDLGGIHTFNEGAVPFSEQDLRAVLAVDPRMQRQESVGRGITNNIMVLSEAGLRLRWLTSQPPGEHDTVYGQWPPPVYDEAVTHVGRYETELKRLPAHGLLVPAHTTFVVEKDPYRHIPVVYTAVEEITEPPLMDFDDPHDIINFPEPDQLEFLGNHLIDLYVAGRGLSWVIGADAARPRQYTRRLAGSPNFKLIDLDSRLNANPGDGLQGVCNWVRYIGNAEIKTRLLQRAEQAMRISPPTVIT